MSNTSLTAKEKEDDDSFFDKNFKSFENKSKNNSAVFLSSIETRGKCASIMPKSRPKDRIDIKLKVTSHKEKEFAQIQ